MECPFCHRIAVGEVIAQNDLAAAFFDGFPVSPGHTLIVPIRHEADFFFLSQTEQSELWNLLPVVRQRIETGQRPPTTSPVSNLSRK